MLEVTDLTARLRAWQRRAPGRRPGSACKAAKGELVSIVGPSGCGKSTVLRCIAGLLSRPARGTVTVNGPRYRACPKGSPWCSRTTSRSLYPWLSVRDNVALPLRRTQPRPRPAPGYRPARAHRGRPGRRRATATPGSCPAGCSSGWPSPGRSPATPSCCSWTSPSALSTPRPARTWKIWSWRLRRDRDITILLVTHDIDESVYTSDRVIVLTAAPGGSAPTCPCSYPNRATRSPPRNCLPSCTCGPKLGGWSAGSRPRWGGWGSNPRPADYESAALTG